MTFSWLTFKKDPSLTARVDHLYDLYEEMKMQQMFPSKWPETTEGLPILEVTEEQSKILNDAWVIHYNTENKDVAYSMNGFNWFKIHTKDLKDEESS